MHCTIIPDNILKLIKDRRSLKISQRLRNLRNKLKVKDLVQPLAAILTFNTKNTTNLPGDIVAKDDNISPEADDLAFLAHIGAKQVYQWLLDTFNRNSVDDKGFSLQSTVHYDKNYNNAFWNSTQMVYGDGDGKFFLPLAKSDDVRAHEMGHGVIEHTAGLVYWEEPGALNESFADVLGVSFKHYIKKQSDPKTADWTIGGDITGPNFPGKAIRVFTTEKAYRGDPQPNHYKDKYRGFSDNMGVHINSKITNRVFYIFCMETGYASYNQPVKLWYNTLLKLNKYSRFKSFAKLLSQTSVEMFGENSKEHVAILKGLQEVGL